jgi:hypothetical protein
VAGVVTSAAVLLGGLTGCGSSDVHVDRFAVTPAGKAQCPDLLAALPDRVADQERRTTTGSRYAVAWGDPAIVLRCGLERPADSTPSSPCMTRDGIDWTVPPEQLDDLQADVDLTLAHRSVYVRVHVPATYRPNGPGEAMADVDPAVRDHTRAVGHCP